MADVYNNDDSRLLPGELKDREGNVSGNKAVDQPLSSAETGVAGGLYNPNDKNKKFSAKNFFWGNRKRKLLTSGTGVASGVIASIIALVMIAAGPAELVQLSNTLEGANFDRLDSESSTRLDDEMAYFSGAPQDIGATRLGNLSQLTLKPIFKQLDNSGISFSSNGAKRLNGVSVNADQLAANNESFAGLDADEQRQFLADTWGVDPSAIDVSADPATGSAVFSLASEDASFTLKTTRLIVGNTMDLLDGSDILQALMARTLNIYYGAPNLLFHPLKYLTEKASKSVTDAAQQNAQVNSEEESEVDPIVEAETDSPLFNVAGIKAKLNTAFDSTIGKALSYLLVVQAVYCEVRGQVGNIVSFNRDAIVLPAALEAVRFIALGHQVEQGDDLSATDVGDAVESLTNSSGQSIWNAQALQVEENKVDPSGTDLPASYSEAFSSSTGANELNNAFNTAAINGFTCSAPVEALTALLGLAIIFADLPDGESGTALYDLAARTAVSAGFGFGIYFGIHFALYGLLKDNAVVPDVLSGPLGGNLLAYGAREASNIDARSEGGVALSSTDTQQLAYQAEQQSNKQFESESLFSRLFNIDDSRSLLGHLAQSISPSLITNITNFADYILSVSADIPKELLGLLPNVSADSNTSYNWGWPEYGVPTSLLNSTDPTMENPYANAEFIVNILKNYQNPKSPLYGEANSLISNAQTCFGDSILPVNGVWDVVPIPNYDVNPSSSGYEDANDKAGCATTNTDWEHLMLYIFDTRTMEATACYQGVNQGCTEIGMTD